MSNIMEYARNRDLSNKHIEKLNLSEEFETFKTNQFIRHDETLKKFNKTKNVSLLTASAGVVGLAGCIVGGVLTAPVLAAGVIALYTSASFGIGAKLGELFSKDKFNKEFGDSDTYFKKIDSQNRSMGKEFYSDFVNSMSNNPGLSESLSIVSKNFRKKKEELDSQIIIPTNELSTNKIKSPVVSSDRKQKMN